MFRWLACIFSLFFTAFGVAHLLKEAVKRKGLAAGLKLVFGDCFTSHGWFIPALAVVPAVLILVTCSFDRDEETYTSEYHGDVKMVVARTTGRRLSGSFKKACLYAVAWLVFWVLWLVGFTVYT